MKYDPHTNDFCAKNLREEEWFEFQRNIEVVYMADAVRHLTEDGKIAVVNIESLYRFAFFVSIDAGTPACLYQYSEAHWAAMAIAMMTHCYFEKYPDEGIVRFTKSPINQEPMYYNNIEWVEEGRWQIPVRKNEDSKALRTTGNRQNYKTNVPSSKGIGDGNTPQQGRLFNIYTGC
jgi:hypothetical protein